MERGRTGLWLIKRGGRKKGIFVEDSGTGTKVCLEKDKR